MNSIFAARKFVIGELRSSAALSGVSVMAVPAPLEFTSGILVQIISPDDVNTTGQDIITTECTVSVLAVEQSSAFAPLESKLLAIQDALHQKSGSNSSGVILGCYRDSIVPPYFSLSNGIKYTFAGAIYRVVVQGA